MSETNEHVDQQEMGEVEAYLESEERLALRALKLHDQRFCRCRPKDGMPRGLSCEKIVENLRHRHNAIKGMLRQVRDKAKKNLPLFT